MVKRFAVLASLIVLLLMILPSAVAQDNVEITIFVDEDTLVVSVPGNQLVSLQDLGFEVVINDQRKLFRLDQFPAFEAVRFNAVPAPICFRLARDGSNRALPLECDAARTLTHYLADANVFWYDSVANYTRTFLLLRGADPLDLCAAEQDSCPVVYVPPAFTPTPDPLQAALDRARNFSGSNNDWEPFVWNFDGVEMVLVPSGCFMMGSSDEELDDAVSLDGECDWFTDEQPRHEVCFAEPFWIDKYEVSQGQFAAFGGQAAAASHFTGDDLPRENITWFETRDFCALRGARLPTEAEWEYTARGPDGLIYPWGNEFVGDNVIYEDSPEFGDTKTAPIGSRPGGVSWVGAVDMSGNVWEWVSTVYQDYPYQADDEHEDYSDKSSRVLRGGSFDYFSLAVRAANRVGNAPDFWDYYSGFRCARSVD